MDFSRYENLRTLVRANFSEQTRALVDEALVYADGKLTGLCRYDGTPLLDHAVAVAMVVISEVGLGRNSTVSAILHDVVRLAHKQLPAEEFLALTADIRDRFGEQVVGLTMGLANISELKLKVAKEQADNFRDLLVSYSEDPRVILIKLADRLEVMRSLEMFPREKWRKKSWESMNLYAQIAHKLGLYSLKSELEDIALKYLEPKDYEHIVTKLEESADERKAFIARFLVPIEERLHKLGIKYHIKSRTKSIFSIWTKMHKQHVPFEGVYDIFALRIILDCPPEEEKTQCWAVYSIVTDYYIPNTERLRDWISIPKYGADGNVEEVSLTTVKIRNWDNTLVMLPPYLLTTDSFTNWHAMQLSGGRRVMRSVAIDMTSVRFCTPEMLDHYRTIDLIRDYVDQTERRVEEYNAAHGIGSGERRINGLHQTNLGVFRAYLVRYLRNEVPVNKDMTLMVRQLQPTETGLPMQLYFFTDTVVWVDYEGIQSDVFDHVLAVIPEFGLRVFQNPSGEDVASLRNAFSPNAQTPSQTSPQTPPQTSPQASPQASSQVAPQNAPPLHASRPAAPQRPQAEQPAPEEAKAPASASPE